MLTFLRYLEQRAMKFVIGARNRRTTMASMVLLFHSGPANLHAGHSTFPSKPEQKKQYNMEYGSALHVD